MIRTFAALGILGAAGALSICDLCTSGSARPLASLVASAQGAPVAAPAARSTIAPAVDEQTVTFRVDGMTCGGCVIGVRKVLTRLAGVAKAEVSYETQRAVVTYDPAKVTVEQMIAAIRTLGYRASVIGG